MKLGYRRIIIIFAIFFLLLPLFFERLYDDEAIYWSQSKAILEKGLSEIPKMSRMPLAILIVSPFLAIDGSIFTSRIITALFAIASAVLVFEITKMYSDEKAAFISSLLFIFSFQTIRFGTRFYIDAYGVFFFLLSVYFAKKNRIKLAGLSFSLAMLSREIWFGLYPFMIIYLWRTKKSVSSFVLSSAVPFIVFAVFIQSTVGIGTYIGYSAAVQAPLKTFSNTNQILEHLIQGWAEFLVISIITVVGFVSWIWGRKEDILILILPQFLVISLIPGFISNGSLTQYTMGLQASMALLAGPGLIKIYKKYFKKYPLYPLIFSILILQFLLFSYLATALSLRGALGVHDFGYWYDEEVISLLNEKAGNETIAGLHGAFIKDARGWVWYERDVNKVLELEPDWYIIVEPQTIQFKTGYANNSFIEVYRIGPYIVLHSNPPGHLHEVIEPNEEFNKWMFRG